MYFAKQFCLDFSWWPFGKKMAVEGVTFDRKDLYTEATFLQHVSSPFFTPHHPKAHTTLGKRDSHKVEQGDRVQERGEHERRTCSGCPHDEWS